VAIADAHTCCLQTPFEESTKAVFATMLGWKLETVSSLRLPAFHPQHDVSGIIGFSNAMRGTAVISLDEDVALSAAEVFIGSRPDSINSDVLDMVGEFANMIGGNAKQQIGIVGVCLGMPTVVTGRELRVSFESGAHVEFLSFSSPKGPLCVQWAVTTQEQD
jgi:chemotaxis protein CheX